VNRFRCPRAFFLVFLVGILPIAAQAGGGSSPTYDGVVNFGAQILRMGDGCLSIGGTLASGTFFEDLKRTDVRGRLEYHKRGKVVTDYPESVTTSIRIVGGQCAASSSNAASSIFGGDSYSVKFTVEWKDGMQLRPAVLSPVVAHCVGYSSVTIPDRGATIPSITCQMTVNSRGVPLVDHLIVSVFAPYGNRLTRISAAP
jgi:hypothetical protein